ncbi:MAG: aminoacyl-tRNA hydrolase [Spirochaetaceae bacterium]|jgi:PTH1 family peptidyl-tRNA hydrolase|nr:aminoacyl-tRNA hydrolase [Spirochaetaceae bacterium]
MIELVAFLGNPGVEYSHTRHNAGRLLAERLPFFSQLTWRKKYKGRYAALDGNRLSAFCKPEAPAAAERPATVHFLMPETYMNISGEAIQTAASFFKIPPERILLAHDELELPLGTASIKFSGGLGGHNGLRSMNACFGTAAFWRFRIGIGRPDHRDISGWVLSGFSAREEPIIDQVLAAGAAALTEALLQGPGALLPEWNKKKIVTPPLALD